MSENNFDISYKDLVAHFGSDKIEDHCAIISAAMDAFISRYNYGGRVNVAESILFQAIIDYFTDIYRLKTFHNIDKVNANKIHAYTAYWLVRRKPIQIIKDNDEDVVLPFINEKFVQSYLLGYLKDEYSKIIINEKDSSAYDSFSRNLEYLLRYRVVTPQMLETMIEAYLAGRAFQHTVDLNYNTTLL